MFILIPGDLVAADPLPVAMIGNLNPLPAIKRLSGKCCNQFKAAIHNSLQKNILESYYQARKNPGQIVICDHIFSSSIKHQEIALIKYIDCSIHKKDLCQRIDDFTKRGEKIHLSLENTSVALVVTVRKLEEKVDAL